MAHRFAAQNRSRVSHIKRQLQNLQQGNKNCADYVQTAKGLANQLAAVGKPVEDDDLISCVYLLHCPSASANLLSIHQFCVDNDWYFVLTSSHFFVKDMQTGEILLQGPCEAGLYPMHLKQISSKHCRNLVAFIGVKTSLSTWHNRLGHPAYSVIQQLLRNSHLSVSSSQKQDNLCEPCQLAKSKKLPFPNSNRISQFPLQLIHSDVWTSPVQSLSGCRFYVLFVDDFSRFTWLFPLKHKSEVFVCFLKYKCLVENLLSHKIKQIQTDGGGEYISSQFKAFLENNGIAHRISCPYTSEQNGIAECKHRHVVETGLALHAHSHLPNNYWVDAFLTAIYLINRLPTPTLNNNNPYTKLFKIEPNYSILRVFGCVFYTTSLY